MTVAHPVDDVRDSANALAARGAWTELATFLAKHEAAARAQPELANLRGEAFLRSGRPREARAWVTEVMPAIERRGDRVALRRAVNLLGVAQFELGDLATAEPAFDRALELGREDGDDLLVARAMNNLGTIANVRGDRERALSLYALAVTAYQRLGQCMGLAESYHNMAITFRDLGTLDRADECERRAIEFAREAGNARLIALGRLGRAEISLRSGDAALAGAAARRAAADLAAVPDPIQQAYALRLVGLASQAEGDVAEARESLDAALALARAHGGALDEAETLRARAELWVAMGDLASGRADARAAIAIFDRMHAVRDRDALARWAENNTADAAG